MKQTCNYKRTFYVLALVFAFLCAPIANAAGKGFYVGASLGNSEIKEPGELDDLCATAGVVCADKGDDTALGLFFGYQFGPYFATELGYMNPGELSVGTVAPVEAKAFFEVKGFKLVLLPQIPIGKIGAIVGKVGVMGGDTELGADAPALGYSARDSGTTGAIVYGIGGAINIGRNVTIRVEWERLSFDHAFDLAGVSVEAPDVDVIGGAVIVRFNTTPR